MQCRKGRPCVARQQTYENINNTIVQCKQTTDNNITVFRISRMSLSGGDDVAGAGEGPADEDGEERQLVIAEAEDADVEEKKEPEPEPSTSTGAGGLKITFAKFAVDPELMPPPSSPLPPTSPSPPILNEDIQLEIAEPNNVNEEMSIEAEFVDVGNSVEEENEQFHESIDLKTEFLAADPHPDPTHEVVDLADDEDVPTTSSKLKTSDNKDPLYLSFKHFKFEKHSSYFLKFKDERKRPVEYTIFNSIQDWEHKVKLKLFVSKQNLQSLLGKVTCEDDWDNVGFNFEEGTSFAALNFPKSGCSSVVQAPGSIEGLEFTMKYQKSFVMSNTRLGIIKRQLGAAKLMCERFVRDNHVISIKGTQIHFLGFEWIQQLFTKEAVNSRIDQLNVRFLGLTKCVIKDAEVNSRAKVCPKHNREIWKDIVGGWNICLCKGTSMVVLSEYDASVVSEFYAKYEEVLLKQLEELHQDRSIHNEDIVILEDSPRDPLYNFTYESSNLPKVKVNIKTNRAAGKVMWKHRKVTQSDTLNPCLFHPTCKEKFKMDSFEDLLNFAVHCNASHFNYQLWQQQFKMLCTIFCAKDSLLEAVCQNNSNIECAIPWCNKNIKLNDQPFERGKHYPAEHKIEAFLVHIFTLANSAKMKQLQNDVRAVHMPSDFVTFMKKCEDFAKHAVPVSVSVPTPSPRPETPRTSCLTLPKSQSFDVKLAGLNTTFIKVTEVVAGNLPDEENQYTNDIKKLEVISKHKLQKEGQLNFTQLELTQMDMSTIHRFICSLIGKAISIKEAKSDLKALSCGVTQVEKVQLRFTAMSDLKIFKDLWEVYDSLLRWREWMNGNFSTTSQDDLKNFLAVEDSLSTSGAGDEQKLQKFLFYADVLHGPFKDGEKTFSERKDSLTWKIAKLKCQFTCITCFSATGKNYNSVEGVKNHIHTSSMNVHGIQCIDCNEVYTVNRDSHKESFFAVHITQKSHIKNVYSKTEEGKYQTMCDIQTSISCDVCGVIALGMINHANSVEHKENVKLLAVYLKFCEYLDINPIQQVPVDAILFFLRTLKYFLPVTIARCEALSRIMKDYIFSTRRKDSEDNWRASKLRDSFNITFHKVILEEDHSAVEIICYPCKTMLSKKLKHFKRKGFHKSGVPNIQCLKCCQMFSAEDLIQEDHVNKCNLEEQTKVLHSTFFKTSLHLLDLSKTAGLIVEDVPRSHQKKNDAEVKVKKKSDDKKLKVKLQKKRMEKEYYQSRLAAMSEIPRDNTTGTAAIRPRRKRKVSGEYSESMDYDPICLGDYLVGGENSEDEDDPSFVLDDSQDDTIEIEADSLINPQEEEKEEVAIVKVDNPCFIDIEDSGSVSPKKSPNIVDTETFASFDELFGSPEKNEKKRKLERLIDNVPEVSEESRKEETKAAEMEREYETEYYYFCLDCEKHKPKKNCTHLDHSRVPIGMDISKHLQETGHANLQPIRDFVLPVRQNKMLKVKNISYCKTWGPKVRKCWKRLVLSGKLTHLQNFTSQFLTFQRR